MLHRSSLTAVAAAAACALLPAAASAQSSVSVPAGAPTIEGTYVSGQSAIVFTRGGQVCAIAQAAGEPRPTTLGDEDGNDRGGCVDTPVLGPFGRRTIAVRQDDGRFVEIGVVGAATARVQFRKAGAVVATSPTTASPLPGAAAGLRFYILTVLTGSAPLSIDEVALLDTFDTVQRALDPADPFQGGTLGPFAASPAPPGRVLHRGTYRGRAWTQRTRIDHPIAGTPLLPERRADLACATFAAGRGNGGELCDHEALATQALLVDTGDVCSPNGVYVQVLARRAVRSVAVVDGIGRRHAVRLGAVPGEATGLRAGALVLGADLALRRVDGLDARGRVVGRYDLGRAPNDQPGLCAGGGAIVTYSVVADSPATAGRAPHAVHLADAGAKLCLAVDRAPRPPAGCMLPPTDAGEAVLTALPTAEGRYVAGLVPREVASVRLTLEDGSHRVLAPGPVTGRYAGLTQLVAGDVPGRARAISYKLLAASGGELAPAGAAPAPPPPRHRTTLTAHVAPGLGPLVAARANVGLGAKESGSTCAAVLSGDVEDRCEPMISSYAVVRVVCGPRRAIVIAAGLHRAGQRLAVRTASGRTVVGRTLPLPAALRRPPALSGVANVVAAGVVVVPAGETPRTLLRRGPAAASTPLRLPAARAQCGYSTFAFFSDSFR